MARIRTIKPEFPQSETIGKLSRDARLLFIQLWTIVDDSGRARAASRMLASLLYPYDDDAPTLLEGWLAELEGTGCIRRYSAEGHSYLDIPSWLKHQKIDRPSASRFPSFDEGSRVIIEPSRILAPDLGPSTLDLGPRTNGIAAVAANGSENLAPDEKTQFYARFKSVLPGEKGGLATKLLKAKSENIALARAALEMATTKANPREYIGAIIRGREKDGKGEYGTDWW